MQNIVNRNTVLFSGTLPLSVRSSNEQYFQMIRPTLKRPAGVSYVYWQCCYHHMQQHRMYRDFEIYLYDIWTHMAHEQFSASSTYVVAFYKCTGASVNGTPTLNCIQTSSDQNWSNMHNSNLLLLFGC